MVYITRYAIKKKRLKENRFFLKKHQNSYHIGSTKGFAQFSQRNFHLHPDGGDINILLFRNFAVRFAFNRLALKTARHLAGSSSTFRRMISFISLLSNACNGLSEERI